MTTTNMTYQRASVQCNGKDLERIYSDVLKPVADFSNTMYDSAQPPRMVFTIEGARFTARFSELRVQTGTSFAYFTGDFNEEFNFALRVCRQRKGTMLYKIQGIGLYPSDEWTLDWITQFIEALHAAGHR